MSRFRFFLAMLVASLFIATGAMAQETVLGKIDFPNSGAAEAQDAFLNGVRMLHSFSWVDAAEQFQEAQRIDPDFALAYWGEALSHTGGHHLSPREQDIGGARRALQKLGRTRDERLSKSPNERERGYLKAVELLYGSGSNAERALAYSEAMAKLCEQYPEDLEAAAFYSISLMRTKIRGTASLREDMQAGAVAQEIFRKNPNHPGAAHYIIHAYDDPVHAPIALYAARKYAEIAPAAVHALHMPSHIFVHHGMWDYLSKSNEASYQASVDWAKRKGLSPTRHSFHSLYWLQYAYLQQGRYDDAQAQVEELRSIAKRDDARRADKERLLRMEALQTVETERWNVGDVDGILAQIQGSGQIDERTAGAVLFASGMSAARMDDLPTAEKATSGLKDLHAKMGDGDDRNQVGVMWKEMEGLVVSAKGRPEEALASLDEAMEIAESMEPPSGPPGENATDSPVKPSHELAGEIVLSHGKHAEALALFERSLLRTPNRVRSLLGAARASKGIGLASLAQRYYDAVAHTAGAGPDVPGIREATEFLQLTTSEDH